MGLEHPACQEEPWEGSVSDMEVITKANGTFYARQEDDKIICAMKLAGMRIGSRETLSTNKKYCSILKQNSHNIIQVLYTILQFPET